MSPRPNAESIDAYIAGFPPETQAALEEIRALIREEAPDAVETISYAIPTFDLGGKHLVHFAGYEHHVGLYPTPSGMVAFEAELAPYRAGKGTARFALGQPLPVDLIRRIVAFRLAEVTARQGGKRIAIQNVNHPGTTTMVDAGKYEAMRDAMLAVLPATPPGFTQAEMREAVVPLLPQDRFPGGSTAGWWAKAVQLDLEAKGVIAREATSPLRWHLIR